MVGRRNVWAVNAFLLALAAFATTVQRCSCLLSLLIMQSLCQRPLGVQLTNPVRRVAPPSNVYMAKFNTGYEGYPVWHTG